MPGFVVATPTLGRVGIEYMRSVMSASFELSDAGFKFGYLSIEGCKYITLAKNRLIRDFLCTTDAEMLLLWDDDVGATPTKVVEFAQRSESVIAGVYPMTTDEALFPVTFCFDSNGSIVTENGLCKATRIPGGFLKIRRHVLEELSKVSKQYIDLDGVVCWNIFEAGPYTDGAVWSEDSVFSQKWLDLGGEIWVDPDVSFEHRGNRVNVGRLSDHLEFVKAA